MKKLEDYKLVIWDLDGTLYFQKEFRLKMAMVLVRKLLFVPKHWKDILVILKYRSLREVWDPSDSGEDLELRQYAKTGEHLGLTGEEVQGVIQRWMLEEPLLHLKKYRDEIAVTKIEQLKMQGILTVVYSDYPTRDKLEALGIEVADSFSAMDEEIGCIKPNPKGIEYILKKYSIEKKDAIMIGDRMEKDGEAALNAGIDYLILKRKSKDRKNQYKTGIGPL